MIIIKWILIIYCLISLLSLFNAKVRQLYIDAFVDKHRYKGKVKSRRISDFLIHYIGNLLIVIFTFIVAPVYISLVIRGNIYKKTKDTYSDVEPVLPINTEYLKLPLIIKVGKDVPFVPDKQQVIYLESYLNEAMNTYISMKYEDICKLFEKRGFTFIYIPRILERLGFEEAKYLNPALNEEAVILDSLTSQQVYDKLISFTDVSMSLTGGLLRYKEDEEDYYIFTYYQFVNLDKTEIWEQFRAYLSVVGNDRKMYSASPNIYTPTIDPEDNADYVFDSESKKLIDEIKERLELLKQKGINELVLKSLFSQETAKLSKLIVSNEYKIYLPDYNNLEITMYPLPKAVFFLFLNHPEGILFKHLPDYRDELIAIYKKISGREKLGDMEKSINDIVNPTLNSINEKCSRIREAFIRHFDESIAQNYFIIGERATPKRIALDRELVVLEGEIKFDVVKTPFEYTKHLSKYNKTPKIEDELWDDLPF